MPPRLFDELILTGKHRRTAAKWRLAGIMATGRCSRCRERRPRPAIFALLFASSWSLLVGDRRDCRSRPRRRPRGPALARVEGVRRAMGLLDLIRRNRSASLL